ncbi:molybdenum cofactor guanylyltransferase [Synechococcus sp. PCC 7335]|uniref:molybdenum cofactor guanylyltransferase n=1 Tax=Synechococcus sp. (strain ATCC 29403 / PCC 7335) TaxID=91464 RepID=UPI0018DE2340|nr:molybdenum cofactor guanylyltransferase [Synechococcus sp. PCC 7335]
MSSVSTAALAIPALSVMILAGGRSRRMGKDKALLPMGNGQSLLLNTVQIAQMLSTETVVVTPWPERYQDSIPDSVSFIKEPLPPTRPYKDLLCAGPLSGFAYGWQAISSDWCLLLACDLPHLEAAVIQRWWEWLTAYLNDTQSPIPMASLAPGPKGWEPLCGYYHRGCVPSLKQYLHRGQNYRGQNSFQTWLSNAPIVPYKSVPKKMLFNCNTPADWAVASAQSDISP